MKRTRISELLGIKYPIIQGGMGWVANAELAAAVSNAGGLGTIAFSNVADPDWRDLLRAEIRKVRSLTKNPFQLNVSLEVPFPRERIDVAIEEGVKTITIAAGNPALHTKYIKSHGMNVMQMVFSVKHARRAEAEGVDAVVASGVEAGGLLSHDELTTMVLVPQVVDAVKIPVVAAGGIADARGLAAALLLGAEGVQIGTRFLCSSESPAHTNYKESIVRADDVSTVITGRRARIASRVIRNDFARQILEMEFKGVSADDIEKTIGLGRLKIAAVDGDVVNGSLMAGADSGLVKSVECCRDIIDGMVEEYDRVISRLKGIEI